MKSDIEFNLKKKSARCQKYEFTVMLRAAAHRIGRNSPQRTVQQHHTDCRGVTEWNRLQPDLVSAQDCGLLQKAGNAP